MLLVRATGLVTRKALLPCSVQTRLLVMHVTRQTDNKLFKFNAAYQSKVNFI